MFIYINNIFNIFLRLKILYLTLIYTKVARAIIAIVAIVI